MQFEIGGKKPQRRAKPMPGRAADLPEVAAAETIRPFLSNVTIIYTCWPARMGNRWIRRFGHSDSRSSILFHRSRATDARSSFNDGDPQSSLRKAPSGQRPSNPRAHYQNVGCIAQIRFSKIGGRGCPDSGAAATPARLRVNACGLPN